MKRIPLLFAMFILLFAGTSHAAIMKYQDVAQDRTGRVIAGATVSVYLQGTTTAATLYSTEAGASKGNPVTADNNGLFWFYIEEGRYDLDIAKRSYQTQNRTDVWIFGGSSGSGAGIIYCPGFEPTDGQVVSWDVPGQCYKGTTMTVTAGITYCYGFSPTNGQFVQWDEAGSCYKGATPSGFGDMIGPSDSTDNEMVLYSYGGGKTVKRSTDFTGMVKVLAGVVSIASPTADYIAASTISNATTTGLLSMADWSTFNNKLSATSSGALLTGITATQVGAQPVSTNLTSLSSFGAYKIPYTDGSSAMTALALGSAGQILTSGGPSSTPTFTSTISVPKASGVAGRMCIYTSYLTDVYGTCEEGPTDHRTSNLVFKKPNGSPTDGQVISWGTPSLQSSGDYVTQGTYTSVGSGGSGTVTVDLTAPGPIGETTPSTIKATVVTAESFSAVRTDNPQTMTLYEATSDGNSYGQFTAPARGVGFTGNRTYTLPDHNFTLDNLTVDTTTSLVGVMYGDGSNIVPYQIGSGLALENGYLIANSGGGGSYSNYVANSSGRSFSQSDLDGAHHWILSAGTFTLPIPVINLSSDYQLSTTGTFTFNVSSTSTIISLISGTTITTQSPGIGVLFTSPGMVFIRSGGESTYTLSTTATFATGVTYTTSGAAMTLDDSYALSSQSSNDWLCTTYSGVAQSFTSGGGVLDHVNLLLTKVGSPTGNLTAKIYAHSGTYGTSSVPTGSALATSDPLDVTTLTGSYALNSLTFSGTNRITLTAGYYDLVVSYSGGDCTNDRVILGADDTSPTHSGNQAYYDNSWHIESGVDAVFDVYVLR